ncbi:MAG: AraC family transcriptional regulator [Clostridiales bacterium]|nr:AraC family transcriptional regulator [Clostridiales bacterium]
MFYENKRDYYISYEETTSLQYPLHLHQYIELVHVVKGLLEMQVGNAKYSIHPGDFVIIFPNIPHSYHTLSMAAETQLNIINCYVDLLPLLKPQLMTKHPTSPKLSSDQIHEDVLYAEKKLYELRPQENDMALIGSLLSLILCRLFSELTLEDYKEQPPQDITGGVIAYIADHYLEEITLSSVANHFGIGKYALSRIFSNVLGCSFISYVNTLRIDYAVMLLMNTDMNITRIAVESGFNNQQTFNRVFKKLHGCTPKEYRNRSVNMDKMNNAENDYHNLPFEDVEA